MAGVSGLLLSLGLIASGLLLGYLYRNVCPHGVALTEEEVSRLRRGLQAAALLYVNPVAFGGAIWALELDDPRIVSLPFIGAFALILGGVLAFFAASALGLGRRQRGVFVTCGGFTNIGSIGSLVTFFLLGEGGVALVSFYKLFEDFIYYGVGFPYAKSMSDAASTRESLGDRLRVVLADRFVVVAVLSMAAGLGLNLLGVERPGFYSALNAVLIPVGTLLMLSSIGMAMRFGRLRGYLRDAGVIALIKFLAVPGGVYMVCSALGLGSVDGGLPLRVSVTLASMPVAFMAMVPPTLYDLDVDLANAAWLVTTGLLVVVVPALWLFLA